MVACTSMLTWLVLVKKGVGEEFESWSGQRLGLKGRVGESGGGRTVCVGASHALFSKRVFHLVVQ